MSVITENSNPDTFDIDLQKGVQIARLINNEDKKIADAIAKIIPQIGKAIDLIAERLQNGGRMAYFGAGTSGRIGVLDASEMPPTFGVNDQMIQGFIAGGDRALRNAVENAEDKEAFAADDMKRFDVKPNDVVVAISASGNPKYTLEVLRLAREAGALTIALTSNPEAIFKMYADIFLNPVVGPEAVTGSSRMKSGSAQKMVLNMLSTGVMICLGKTYHNYMVDLQITNEKLQERAVRIISEICNIDLQTAADVLQESGNVKTACVMIVKGCNKVEAEKLLAQHEGILRRII